MNTATIMTTAQPQVSAKMQTKAQGTAKSGNTADKQSFGKAISLGGTIWVNCGLDSVASSTGLKSATLDHASRRCPIAASMKRFTTTSSMDALEQKGQDARTAAADDMQESAADAGKDTGNVMEDVPQDPLAFVLAASQQKNNEPPQMAEEPLPQESGEPAAVQTDAKTQDVLAKEQIPAIPAENTQTKQADLQSLIPQSAEVSARNKDFLAMLSGQQLKQAGTENTAQAAEPAETRPQQAATMLEAQLLSKQNAGGSVQVKQENLPGMNVQTQPQQNLSGMNTQVQMQQLPQENLSGVPMQQSAEPVMQPAVLQTAVQRPLAQNQVEQKPGQKTDQGVLAGINLSVEDETPVVPLRMDAQQAMNQQNSQDGQQNASQQEFAKTMTAKVQVQPLAEENASAQAAAPESGGMQSTGGAVSMFQQTLQESITGTSGSKPAEASQPQTDFDIPRQIVDQARLIRRAEDTQMVIKLNPEHLGELTLKVSVTQNGSVNAAFHSDNAQVRAAIENSLVQLRQELNDQGLKVDSVEVYAGLADGQLPQEQGQQAWQNQQGGSAARGIGKISVNAEEYAEEADGLAPIASQGAGEAARDGVDYRI